MEPLLARTPSPRAPAHPRYVDWLRFGRSRRGRPLVLLAGLIVEAAIFVPAAQTEAGRFRGVPGVTAVAVACAVAALCGPVAGGTVAFLAAIVFMVAVVDEAFASGLVLVLWPAVGVFTGLLCNRLLASEAEREQLVARVIEAERRDVAGRIVGGIGHHFNNQLTVIMGNAELARLGLDEDTDKPTVAALEALRAAGERLAGITRLLFILSGGRESAVGTRDAGAALRALEDQLAAIVAPRRLAFEVAAAACMVEIEDGMFDVLVSELVRNAAEASPEEAPVRVTLNCTEAEVVLEVADEGPGMDPAMRRHAFEPFFSTKPPNASTGLGLPVARAVAERAGGSLALISTPGEGTIVCARLPLAAGGRLAREPGAEPSRRLPESI